MVGAAPFPLLAGPGIGALAAEAGDGAARQLCDPREADGDQDGQHEGLQAHDAARVHVPGRQQERAQLRGGAVREGGEGPGHQVRGEGPHGHAAAAGRGGDGVLAPGYSQPRQPGDDDHPGDEEHELDDGPPGHPHRLGEGREGDEHVGQALAPADALPRVLAHGADLRRRQDHQRHHDHRRGHQRPRDAPGAPAGVLPVAAPRQAPQGGLRSDPGRPPSGTRSAPPCAPAPWPAAGSASHRRNGARPGPPVP